MTECSQTFSLPTREKPVNLSGWKIWTETDFVRGEVYAFFRMRGEDKVEWESRRPCDVDAYGAANVTIHIPTYLACGRRLKHGWITLIVRNFALESVALHDRSGDKLHEVEVSGHA